VRNVGTMTKLTVGTDDRHGAIIMRAISRDAQLTMRTIDQWQLHACALHVIKPNWSWAGAVPVRNHLPRSPVHTVYTLSQDHTHNNSQIHVSNALDGVLGRSAFCIIVIYSLAKGSGFSVAWDCVVSVAEVLIFYVFDVIYCIFFRTTLITLIELMRMQNTCSTCVG